MKRSLLTVLIISFYTFLIMILLTFVGTVFFPYSRLYRTELLKIEHQELSFIAGDIMSSYIDLTTLFCFNMFTGSSEYSLLSSFILKNDGIVQTPQQIFQGHKTLEELTNSYGYEKVLALELYNPSTELLISSQAGVKSLTDPKNWGYRELDWIDSDNPGWVGSRIIMTIPGVYTPESAVFSYANRGVHFMFSSRYLSRRLANLSSGQGCFLLWSRRGGLIAVTDNFYKDLDPSLFDSQDIKNGEIIKVENRRSYYVSLMPIESSDWILYKLTSVDEFYRGRTKIQLYFFGTVFSLLLIGAAVSYWVSRSIYRPIGELATELFPLGYKEDRNEITAINTYIRHLSDELHSLEEIHSDAVPLIRNNLIRDLLTLPYIDNEEWRTRSELADISFPHGKFRTLVFQFGDKVSHISLEKKKRAVYTVLARLEGLSNNNAYIIGTEIRNNGLGVIFNFGNAPDFEGLHCKLAGPEEAAIPMIFAVGPETTMPVGNIHQNFLVSDELLDYRFLMPDKTVFMWEEFSSRISGDEGFAVHMLEFYKEAFAHQNWSAILERLESDTEKIQRTQIGIKTVRHFCNNLVFNASRLLIINDILHEGDLFGEMRSCPSMTQFNRWFSKKILDIQSLLNSRQNTINGLRVSQAKEYLLEHVHENVSLQEISSLFKLTPEHFSRIFKSETGVTFIAFVSEMKLILSRDLLLSTDLTIKEIIGKTGYSSTAYFDRKFKERYTMTPMQYRLCYMEKSDLTGQIS